MSWKALKQTSFADALTHEHEAIKELDDLDNLVDWGYLEDQLRGIHNKRMGEKAWPPLMMFKALLLQAWYNLSDPALEKQLARDLLFKRFVGLSLSESVPDHSSLWRFRNLLEEKSLYEPLLAELNQQLSTQGLIIRSGEVSIIDASVIEAKQCRPNKDKDGNNTQDPEAAYNVKTAADGKRKTTYGYKVHTNVEEDGFVKAYALTAGNVHDSNEFESLLTGEEKAVYADSAYKSQRHDKSLDEKNIDNRVLKRAYRNRPLTAEEKQENRINSATRSIVERVFGVVKLHYGLSKARYMGLVRNRARLGLVFFAHNLKRAGSIQAIG